MKKTTEVKTSELSGPLLDWAVAIASAQPVVIIPWAGKSDASTGHKMKYHWHRLFVDVDVDREEWSPSIDWAQGGPLIQKHNVWLAAPYGDRRCWNASYHTSQDHQDGDTALIAACRAIVSAKLGDVVSVPVELITP